MDIIIKTFFFSFLNNHRAFVKIKFRGQNKRADGEEEKRACLGDWERIGNFIVRESGHLLILHSGQKTESFK